MVIAERRPLKQAFLAALRQAVDDVPPRADYYPGSAGRVEQLTSGSAALDRRRHGRMMVGPLSADADEPVLRTEAFSPVLGVVEVPGSSATYLHEAVGFVNDRLPGTLGVNLLIHPGHERQLGPAFDDAVEALRYGTIAINAWTAFGYLTAAAPWGAYPGHTLDDAQSGIGVVHNALLLARTERTLLRGPFRPVTRSLVTGQWTVSPTPPWFVGNRTGAKTSVLLVEYLGRPIPTKLLRLVVSAMRG